MIAVIQEAYVHGVSTRSVDDLVKAMGMTRVVAAPGVASSRRSTVVAQEFLSRSVEAPGRT